MVSALARITGSIMIVVRDLQFRSIQDTRTASFEAGIVWQLKRVYS